MTYPATQTYWLDPTDRVQLSLRRYARRTDPGHYHDASVWFEECRALYGDDGYRSGSTCDDDVPPHGDPRWPLVCDAGDGYEFTPDDEWQVFAEQMMRRADGTLVSVRDAEPGACWDAWWLHGMWPRADGIALMVKCPNGQDWTVDSEASNCTRPGEPHECWVRHGDPRECRVTVDKDGDTCAAGAGSILAGDYHGFLRDGVLTEG